MKMLLRIFAGLVSVVLLLLATATLLLSTMMHSHWLKDQISSYAKTTTGRELTIKGELHASLWPRLGISVDDVSLSNPAGFSSETFLKAKKLTIAAKIMPLLHRELIVNRATLRDAVVNLEKNAQGKANWVFKSTSAKRAPSPEQESQSSKEKPMKFNIGSFSLMRTTINYKDVQSDKSMSFEDVSLTANQLEQDKAFPLQGHLTVVTQDKNKTPLKFSAEVDYRSKEKKIILNNTKLQLKSKEIPEIEIQGNLETQLKKGAINLADLSFKMGDLKLSGNLSAQYQRDNFEVKGHLNSNLFNLKKLLASTGSSFTLKNKNALTAVELSTDLVLDNKALTLSQLEAKIDEQPLEGQITYLRSEDLIRFTLKTKDLNLENYIPNGSASSSTQNGHSQSGNSRSKSSLQVEGSLSVDHLSYENYRLSNLKTNLKYISKTMNLNDFSADIFDGNTNGSLRLNFSGASPTLSVQQKMTGIHAESLLNVLTGSAKLEGISNVNFSLNASGKSAQSLRSSLNGEMNFTINRGLIKGTDIDYQIDQAISKVGQREAKLSNRGYTPFTRLNGKAQFSQGVVTTPDLELLTPTLRIKSSGSLNLNSKALDYKLICRLLQPQKISTNYLGVKINADLANYDLPAKVACTLNDPCVKVDLGGVLKVLAKEGAKSAVKTAIQKDLIKKVDPNVGKVLDQFFGQ